MKVTKQVPSEGYDWLTELKTADEKDRKFYKIAYIPEGAPLFDEWTQEQYDAWQEEYNPPTPRPEE